MKIPSKPPRLQRVLQCQVDPLRRLPRPLRRRATAILNELRQPSPDPVQQPIEQAHVVAIALDAAAVQGLLVLRRVVYEPP